MNIVVLSGGSGKRLWPLSNNTQSKQFLKLLKNADGENESMVQRVMHQVNKMHPGADITISCCAPQEDILKNQLGSPDLICEPERRDTFPAIALAASYLHYKKNIAPGETFIVCPIDIFAEDAFFTLMTDAEKLVASNRYAIGLIGAVPVYPSGKYGYILRSGNEVTGFIEKPSEEKAKQLISCGALWNCAVFAFKTGYILRHARKYVNFDSFESLYNQYGKLPAISVDYEIIEKEQSISAVVYDGIWKDLGTWNTLTEEMDSHAIGEGVVMSDNCRGTHVLNMLDIPIIVQDISDAVIVAGNGGILISSKHGSSHIKPLVDRTLEQ